MSELTGAIERCELYVRANQHAIVMSTHLEDFAKVFSLARKGLEAEKPINKAWEKINALGGATSPSDWDAGYSNAIDRCLREIEELGGRDPLTPAPTPRQQHGADGTWERCPTCMQQHFILSDGAAVKRGFIDPATVPSPPTEAALMETNDALRSDLARTNRKPEAQTSPQADGVPVAEPTVAGRKDEPSGEDLFNGLSPLTDAGEIDIDEARHVCRLIQEKIPLMDGDGERLLAFIERQAAEIERLRAVLNAGAMLELNNSRLARDYQDLVARLSEAQATIERQAAEIGRLTFSLNTALETISTLKAILETKEVRAALSTAGGGK